MSKLSVLIPSRNEIFLQKTIENLIANAAGELEVIVLLDGYWPDPPLKQDPHLVVVHRPEPCGMRDGINTAAAVSSGDFLMKIDAHCAVMEGYDEILKADCPDDWVVIPRRYALDPETFAARPEKTPVDYHYLSWGWEKPHELGMHGVPWKDRANERKDIKIDDEMSSQGSCWFMRKKTFDRLGGLSEYGYGRFVQEAQEIMLKTWLGGGECKVNKNTWYAHLHKGRSMGRGYFISKKEMVNGAVYSLNYWMGNEWDGRKHDISWLIEKFWPVPGWPEDWQRQAHENITDHWRRKAKTA